MDIPQVHICQHNVVRAFYTESLDNPAHVCTACRSKVLKYLYFYCAFCDKGYCDRCVEIRQVWRMRNGLEYE